METQNTTLINLLTRLLQKNAINADYCQSDKNGKPVKKYQSKNLSFQKTTFLNTTAADSSQSNISRIYI